MRRLAGITVAAMLLVAGGQATVWAQGGKTPKLAAVPLSVEIVNDGTTRISGDGPYVDGVDGTRANIDQYGNLIIAFNSPVTFDYGIPGEGDPDDTLSGLISYPTSYISTLANSGPMQSLGEGASQCVRLNWSHDIPGGYLRHGFHRGFDLSIDPDPDTTSYAVVTRAAGEAKWVIEPKAAQCGSFVNPEGVASVFSQVSRRGKWVLVDYGVYRLPFRLVLTPKQP